MDTNKDGEISKEEFLMAVLPLGEFSNHRRLYIGWQKPAAVWKSFSEIRELIFGGNWAGLFDKLDENGDGTLSLGEFMAQDEVRNSGGLMAALTAFEVSCPKQWKRVVLQKYAVI